jgi:tetratricopeptide (TPR) repeat protein
MTNLEERDATVIQKIGIYFRQKQEYERACDLLERVLEIKKSLKLKDIPADTTDSQKLAMLQSKEFATLYNDLSLTYSGMGEIEYAQEYLILAI